MNIDKIKELLSVIDKTSLEYVKLESNEFNLEVSKKNNIPNTLNLTNSDDQIHSFNAITNEIVEDEGEVESETNLYTVVAPLMGTFYSAPNPNESNFVKVGDIVDKGDTLCIVEAMKLMNEINSEVKGEVVEILAKNEELIEYNQPLFKIRPL